MNGEAVLTSVADGVATVTLNRPDKRNAVDDATRGALIDALEGVGADEAVRAVVLTGAGPAFCAGGDIAGMRARLDAPQGRVGFNGWRRQKRTHRLIATVHGLDKPVVAAVNGPASGLGCDLALACDFVMVGPHATFAMAYLRRGLIPDGGGLYFLPRRVGLARAKELIYSARTIDAAEALAIGLADRHADDVVPAAQGWAAELSRGSPIALALAKSILNRALDLTAEEVFALGSEAQAICYATDEHRDAVRAFLDKSAR
ncbi:enoyl-CoA hydratase/isomerase family protein [Acuticoccus sp.]|uniref:enoyl-CoA hydratase/isomerase family protein n=1 Tax=Acuticoccus sp. TaxID=1904378 RepID=UPI003B5300D1